MNFLSWLQKTEKVLKERAAWASHDASWISLLIKEEKSHQAALKKKRKRISRR